MVHIRQVDPAMPELRPLLQAHIAHGAAFSPEGSDHTMDVGDLCADGVRMWLLTDEDVPLACGGLKPLGDGTAEVKSVHVANAARGAGHARRIMGHLQAEARDAGYSALVLETGSDRLPEYDAARGLYEALGFTYCAPIPGYVPDPNSAFLRLSLNTAS